jgi:hypothetical protein
MWLNEKKNTQKTNFDKNATFSLASSEKLFFFFSVIEW